STCDLADVNCSVIRESTAGGGCKIVYNEECLTEDYAKEMNRFCTSLGDCGGSVNFDGEYVKNFDVDTDFTEGDVWNRDDDSPETFGADEVDRLSAFANYVTSGQVIELDYSGKIASEGFSLDIDEYDAYGSNYALSGIPGFFSGGITQAVAADAGSLVVSAPFLAIATAAISAAAGAIIGVEIAKAFGIKSSLGLFLAGAGGAAIVGSLVTMLLFGWNPVGLGIFVLGLIFSFLSWLTGEAEAECDPINVSFNCEAWSPPADGDNCEACNGDPLKPCSDYRCESLGACELIDKDGSYGICHPMTNDGVPVIISPLEKEGLPMPSGMSYNENSNPLTGFSITKDGDDDCIDAYNSLMFGVNTSKRAKCRFGETGQTFGEMSSFGADAFVYEHTAIVPIANPGGGVDVGGDPKVDASLEMKCQDIFGNENIAGYSVRFCVNGEDSGLPPEVIESDPDSGSFVGFNDLSEPIKIITNEPADCRWSSTNIGYESMANDMECNYAPVFSGLLMGYACTSEVGISTTENDNTYYVRCADQPWGELANSNIMPKSYVYNLTRVDKKIEIDSIKPDEDMESGTRIVSTELEVRTSGGGDSHSCWWSFSGYETMIPFFIETEEVIHTQTLDSLSSGTRTTYINCLDETGDIVNGEQEFIIVYDDDEPKVARIWQEGSSLHIITDEESECVYSDTSCSYNWDDEDVMSAGSYDSEHTISVISGKTYYIKCRDEYENMLSNRYCLVEVQAV
ncbi:MAG: hypothetical protein HQ538_03230, partial [Parcubacteria group bacterium]|nr:hypothetical protein [Parcubacteria group bacterium]